MFWFNVAVTPHFSWPNMTIELPFEGKTIVLSPPTDTLACRAALYDSQYTAFEQCGTILSRFLSRLAWSMNGGVVEFFHLGTNMPNEPGRLRQGSYARSGWATVDPPHCIYLPSATNPNSDLALALYREGLSLNSIHFGFLSLFKVLNIRFGSGLAQEIWINDHLPRIGYQPALDRLLELQNSNENVGKYLFVQGRCAVAHANSSPLIHPDLYEDRRRLEADFPLMKELAALFIEIELGVPSQSSFHKSSNLNFNGSEALMKGEVSNDRILYAPFQ